MLDGCDATELPYQRGCFDHATAFFSCMYMSEAVKKDIFWEAHRILKSGGEFWIWDGNMSPKKKCFYHPLTSRSSKELFNKNGICCKIQKSIC